MKFLRYVPLLLAVLFLASCTKWVAPPYTSVNELSKLHKDMSITQVNEALGIEPYDLYTVQENGTSVLLYNYRVKDRRVTVVGSYNKFIHREASQKDGDPWYGEASVAYVMFKDGKMTSMITNSGREDGELLLLTSNNLQLISRQELVSLIKNEPADMLILGNDNKITPVTLPTRDGTNKGVIVPLREQTKKANPILGTKEKPSGLKKVIKGVGILAGVSILIAIIGAAAAG